MRSPLLIKLLRLINRVGLVSGRPWTKLLTPVITLIRKLISQPQVAELFRFIFLGTIVETGRQMAQWISDFTRDFFMVKAEFVMGDFAYDWVVNYLENHRVWNESRSFMVVARNAATRPYPKSNLGKIDGHPDPLYEPATSQNPSLFRWKGYWMSVTKGSAGWSHYDTSGYGGGYSGAYSGTLVLAVWSRNRHVLDEFVSAARDFYVNSEVLPRKQFNVKSELSESLLTAHFNQGDLSYDWILEFLRSSDAFKDIMELNVTTKQSDLGWGAGPKDSVRYTPAPDSMQRLLYTSPRSGKGTWVQVVIQSGAATWDSSGIAGGTITLTLHSSDREVLSDLINSAKEKYLEQGTSRVSVHLTNNHGSWAKAVTKSRRALSTLVLPADTKEMILADAQEFLASEKWYNMAGIPHRRGYLLYGAPGTGKSSTVHAIAGELGLEIYFISLANPEINDYSLGRLISDTPSRSILLLEDIDCAFPSREEPDEDEDEEPRRDHDGNIIKPTHNMVPAKSAVTLSGLLNVLDSVSSEEGRLTFATTNHIENLDPALIRAGRMDLKIKYSLATTSQMEEVFKIFFPVTEDEGERANFPSYTSEAIERYAAEFAAAMPPDIYSVAQIQGYLLRKKRNPLGAVQGVAEWLTEQEEERRAIIEAKHQWRAELARRRRAEREMYAQPERMDASTLTANFSQGDLSYDWILEFLRSVDAFKDTKELNVTTKQSDLGWGGGSKDSVLFIPAPESMQRVLYTSPRSGEGIWIQVVSQSGVTTWDSPTVVGGTITLTLESSDREVLSDLINSAKEKYLEHGTSRVAVHLTTNHGTWAKAVTKSRRALSTLVLPGGTKEMILADAQEFLASEKWYTMAGIPHRRGYLLYGVPGTGKSSTVHTIAGELGLEIYLISLANPEINDYTLGRLISDTPSRSILLLEDIDCAFPSREEPDEDEDEEPRRDRDGNIIKPSQNRVPAKSAVTLSGLLNVLDSVSSEEGRLTFATTNHIENLDLALIRAGRMDLKIKYSLATTAQIEELFRVFFSVTEDEGPGAKFPSYTAVEIERHAAEFAASIPPDMYPIAQIQGYLLRKRRNPVGAIQGVTEWLAEQEEDRRAIVEAKRRWQLAHRSRADGLFGPRSPGLFGP